MKCNCNRPGQRIRDGFWRRCSSLYHVTMENASLFLKKNSVKWIRTGGVAWNPPRKCYLGNTEKHVAAVELVASTSGRAFCYSGKSGKFIFVAWLIDIVGVRRTDGWKIHWKYGGQTVGYWFLPSNCYLGNSGNFNGSVCNWWRRYPGNSGNFDGSEDCYLGWPGTFLHTRPPLL